MRYIDVLRLIGDCVENEILYEEKGCIAVYRMAGSKSPEGWYLVPKDELAQELMQDVKGQEALKKALDGKK